MQNPLETKGTTKEENAFEVDDAGWKDYLNADFVKGRHQTELDRNALRYIIDVARCSKKFADIKRQLNKDYSVLRKGKYTELGASLAYNKEAAELLLPHIDQIITNHEPGKNFRQNKKINKKLSVSLENNSSYKIEDLFKSIWKLYLKHNDGDHQLTDKMMLSAQK